VLDYRGSFDNDVVVGDEVLVRTQGSERCCSRVVILVEVGKKRDERGAID
jgi:hypothetical protein